MFNPHSNSHLDNKSNLPPPSLRIPLVSYSSQHKLPLSIRAKLVLGTTHHAELELFKRQIIGSGIISPSRTYKTNCNKIFCYRTVFFSLAALFMGIAAFTFFQNLIFFTLLLGNLSFFAKGLLSGTSLLFAILAVLIGYSLSIAREASNEIVAKAKRKLLRLYARKRIENGIQGLFLRGETYQKHIELKHKYKETLDQMHDQQEETIHLLQEIHQSQLIGASHRELLFNQALSELRERVYMILYGFETSEF